MRKNRLSACRPAEKIRPIGRRVRFHVDALLSCQKETLMDLSQTGAVITLRAGEALRLTGAEGRRISAVAGALWVTQDGDPRDIVVQDGADVLFGRTDGAVVQALGGPALVAFEDGIGLPQAGKELDPAVLDHLEIDRRARRARAEATAWLFRELRAGLRRLWARVNSRLLAARTRHELHALSDHMLRDIGLRRSEIDCLVRH
jgi:uncharacterized protein YjiS (DUF1127 family)